MIIYLEGQFGSYNFLIVHLFADERTGTIEFPCAGYTGSVEFDDESLF